MVEFIALIIFVISFGGVIFILVKKMPILEQLPEVHEGAKKEKVVHVLRDRLKGYSPDKVILLKALSRIRVVVLKIEKQIDGWLQKMRKKIVAQKKIEDQRKEDSNSKSIKPPSTPE
ncbi:MAG: hypothetical protein WC845_02460 [Candidatus Staskawiczbacteria bacterium]|jgi:hypothetical protein